MGREFNKRLFTIKEHIPIVNRAAKSFHVLRYVKKNKLFNKQFKERIMLAVIEVNGCELCSYVHSKISLESGMTTGEIGQLLQGSKDDIPQSELVAVLFGENFAASHENPDKMAIDRLIEEYGKDKATTIYSILNMITMTNSMGITLACLKDRLSFKRVKKSKFINEITVPLTTVILFPILYVFHFLTKRGKNIIPNY